MFGKKSEKDPDKKKRKFLTKKFSAVTMGAKMSGGLIAAFGIPLAFVDGGATLLALSFLGGTTAVTSGLMASFDLQDQEKVMRKTNAGQELYGPKWAHDFYDEIQNKLIKTSDKIRYLNQSENKKRKKLEKKKAELIDVAKDLSEYLIVADKDHKPSGEPMLIMERVSAGDKEKDAPYIIDVSIGKPSPKNSPAAFGV